MKKVLLVLMVILSLVVYAEYVNIIDLNYDEFGVKYKIIPYNKLIENNGKNSKESFVAISGIVYDVTYEKPWEKGYHEGYNAGSELTFEILRLSPHGVSKLKDIDHIGILAFTYDELKKFNGKNGNKAYIAVNGIVYDVSHSKLWENGEHKGKHEAGNDLTYEITKLSPHGLKKLDNVFPVGILIYSFDELKKFNGKNGNKAYVAVNGIVYDVSHSKLWKNGEHKGKHEAGNDLTYEITKLSPHGLKKLDNVYKVGYIALNKNELKKFNGKNGNKAYVAVNGIVYDVSHSKLWENGEHKGKHEAGNDLTYEITKLSPHGLKKLDNVYKVGFLLY
ncbi:hypothetical protein X275_10230 [Marinitoga sp. 1197]|uniref:cytochrome b5 domain-containing protein n=1 Tax=Marinitoga sp. 1197 TaxID=1428449 RepID=UPI00065A0BA4|nr:cytochrome b5 domain-containing protein [Marinitoga sp. 1197]KLO20999.1 hypothetical protein X275_10230 [Marinitoga sp. 1197]